MATRSHCGGLRASRRVLMTVGSLVAPKGCASSNRVAKVLHHDFKPPQMFASRFQPLSGSTCLVRTQQIFASPPPRTAQARRMDKLQRAGRDFLMRLVVKHGRQGQRGCCGHWRMNSTGLPATKYTVSERRRRDVCNMGRDRVGPPEPGRGDDNDTIRFRNGRSDARNRARGGRIDSERAIRARTGMYRCTAGLPGHVGAISQASASSDGT